MTFDNSIDAILVRQAKDGDKQAAQDLFVLYYPRLLAVLEYLVHDECISQDLTQDTFEAAWKKLHQLKDERLFKPWLYRIAMNKKRDWQRKCMREKTVPLSLVEIDEEKWLEDFTEKECSVIVFVEVWNEYVRRAHHHKVACLSLRNEGFTIVEIANQLELDVARVTYYLYDARKELRKLLEKAGYAPEPSPREKDLAVNSR